MKLIFYFKFRFYKSLKANLLKPEIFHINPKKSDTPQFRKLMKYIPESVSWYGAYMYNVSVINLLNFYIKVIKVIHFTLFGYEFVCFY